MRKIYVGFIALTCSMGLFAEEVESIVSLSLVNLTKERMNTTYTDSKGNEIAIETHEPLSQGEFLYRTTSDNPLQCVNQSPSEPLAEYSFVILKGNQNANYNNSPSIQITLPSNQNITAIQLLGSTAGSGRYIFRQVLCGFSDTGTNEKDYYMNWDDPIAEAGGDPSFLLYSDECANNADDNYENKRLVPAGAKYVKLIVSKSFGDGGVSADEMELPPYIYAIRFFAKDTPTDIEVEAQDKFSFELLGRNLQLNDIADVSIYDVTGRIATQYNDVDNAYLKHLKNGIYVIKATNGNGQEFTQKVVIR